MALTNTPYNNARYMIGAGDLQLDDATAGAYKALLVGAAYSPNFDTHQYLSDITSELTGSGYVRQALTSISWVKGTNSSHFTSAAVAFAASGGALSPMRMIIFRDTGTPTTSPLMFCILLDDTAGGTVVNVADGQTLQVTPNATNGWGYL